MENEVDIEDVLIRAGKTFIQSVLSIVVASGTDYIDIATWKAAVVAAGAAGISALYNGLKEAFKSPDSDVH